MGSKLRDPSTFHRQSNQDTARPPEYAPFAMVNIFITFSP